VGRESSGTRAPGIVLVTTSWPLPGQPASGTFVCQLARHLAKHQPVTVITPAGAGAAANAGTGQLRVHAVRYAPRPWRRLAQGPGGIPAALRAHPGLGVLVPPLLCALAWASWRACGRGSILHANWAICGVVAGLVGRLRRRPVVTTLRGSDVARAARGKVDRWLLALAGRLSTRVVAVSPSLAEDARALLPALARRIEVISNGVDTALFDIAADHLSHTGAPAVITVGSLVRSKSVGDLLTALSATPQLRLTVVGDGPERAALERQASSTQLAGRVQFTGAVEPAAVASYLAQADAFVTASRREGRSNALLEAMAAALPVVAADIPSARELIEDGVSGLLFPAGDPAGLARCLARLQDPDERARLGQNARERIRALGLTWEAAADRYAALFDELAASAPDSTWRAY